MILTSIFRDSAKYVDRYVSQINALRDHTNVTVVAVEGDSTDDTYDRLKATDFHVIKCESGGPRWASIDHRPRWRQLAACGNIALNAASYICDIYPDEPFVYVESDLMWAPITMTTLADDLHRVEAVAPMSMQGHRFYDSWGFVKDGREFRPYEPYFDGWRHDGLIPIDSSGSCWAINNRHIQHTDFSPRDCIRGIGRTLREVGIQLFLDPTVKVEHP